VSYVTGLYGINLKYGIWRNGKPNDVVKKNVTREKHV
jgi:hypothetical protein